jgi:hypothetical protein
MSWRVGCSRSLRRGDVPKSTAKFDLKAYARQAAAARVAELTAELAAIYRVFPDLRAGTKTASARGRKRNGRPITAAQNAEVSKRMKKYWAARRAKKG